MDTTEEGGFTPLAALNQLDLEYWAKQSPRWLDIVGDYAGQELFVVDGDALVQYCLDDALLALGAATDPSFQITHALWLLESTLDKLIKRDCEFTVVFFEDFAHGTNRTGAPDHVVTSRNLARQVLRRQKIPVIVLNFQGLDDPDWIAYYEKKRPMFMLTHDGGLPTEGADFLQVERVLLRRTTVLGVMSQAIAVVLLQTADFKDGKILSYVFDRTRHLIRHPIPAPITESSEEARDALDAYASSLSAKLLAGTETIVTPPSAKLDDIISATATTFLSSPDDPLDSTLLFLYLAHVALIKTMPLASRAQVLPAFTTGLGRHLTTTFLPKLYACMAAGISLLPVDQTLDDFDLDGRIFLILVVQVAAGSTSLQDLLGPAVYESVSTQWTTLGQSPVDFSTLHKSFPQEEAAPIPFVDDSEPLTLLPFSNAVFDEHLASVHISVSEGETLASTPNRLDSDTVFSDTRHWHSPRPLVASYLGGEKPVVLDARQRKKKDRKEQRYMAQMNKNAQSLTGASGIGLRAQAIPAVGNRAKVKVTANGKAPVVRAAPKKEVPKALTSTEKLLAANEAKKVAEDAVLNGLWWADKLAELKPLAIPAQIILVTSFLRNKRAKDRWLGTEMIIKRLDLEARKWIADESRELPAIRDAYTVFLARTSNDLLQQAVKGEVIINEKQGKALLNVLDAVGLSCLVPPGMVFGAAAAAAAAAAAPVKGKKDKKGAEKKVKDDKKGGKEEKEETGAKLTFSFVSLTKGGKPVHDFMKITEDPVEFQLRCMGEYMVRSLGSSPDSRVSFDPDAWQKEVLDKIDRDESMLIVAPTSAGKTFISFHAMERVLRESDDGVVIYVAPTKALVNQVAAEVFARFRKDVPGKAMWAIHTRDYRINNPQNCQILVTVPHILSTMLLSPALAAMWTPRIKRVILDEIHSISDDEGGAIWEQVLLLNPAPLIGLSATVGAPERFSAWLASIEKTRGREYSLIQHHHRYNALRKFAYAPSLPVKPVRSLAEHKFTPGVLAHVHPIAALALGDATLPSDLALEPVDCLSLFKSMQAADPERLDPSLVPATYFVSTPALKIADVLPYEQALKDVLLKWMEEARGPGTPFFKVVDALESPLRAAVESSDQAIITGGTDFFFSLFTPMLADLHAKNLLPAIIFNFDRGECELIGKRILADLEAGEDRWRKNSPEWKRRVAKAEIDEKLAKNRAKAMERSQKKEDEDGRVIEQDDGLSAFDPDAPSEEFSFCGKGISQVEFAKDLEELAWLQLPSWLINALRRGIGVHHAGMNRRYRTLVENLYRRGILRVVIATGTLSIGINAPAKTCIFGGDSIFLTALNFRQCSGRAGRRGFDTLGNVLFVGVSLHRIERLLVSRLPKLGGSFPLTTTLVLRMHNLLYNSDEAPIAVSAIQKLLTLPQLSVGSTAGQSQVLHFLRFSIEYCRRAGLLDATGRPMNLFGLAQSLYPYEPSNFALIALFRSGDLHKLTANFATEPEETMHQLIIVLSHLFGRVLRRAQSVESIEKTVRNSPSKIILPPLPDNIINTLQKHHESIIAIFSVYAKEYSQQHSKTLGEDIAFPVSGRKVAPSASNADAAGSLASRLEQTKIPIDSRSPFVANSGHGDKYSSISELAATTRAGLVLTKHAVPSMTFLTSTETSLDAYVVDFYRHGQVEALVRDNGIRKSDVWFYLQDFSLALSSIKTALETLLQRTNDEKEEDNDSDDGRNAPAGNADDMEGSMADDVIAKPPGVNIGDYRLYLAISALAKEFNLKFYKIFA